jgi:hypothetical protein
MTEHPTAIAQNVAISGNGASIIAGWWLNDERTSRYAVSGSGIPLWEYPQTLNFFLPVASSDNGNVVASTGGGIPLNVWLNGAGPTPSWQFTYPPDYDGVDCDVSDNGAFVAAACKLSGTGTAAKLFIFNASSATPIWSADFDAGNQLNGVEISEDNQWVVVGCYSNFYVFNMNSQSLFFTGPNYSQTMVGIDDDAEWLATGDFYGQIIVFRRIGNSYTQQWSNSMGGWVTTVDISSDASTVMAGTLFFNPYSGIVRAFDIGGAVRWTYNQYGDEVADVALCNDGSVGVACSWGQLDATYGDVFTAFDMATGTVIYRLLDDINEPGSLFDVDISDDGAYATAGGKAVHARTFGNGGELYAIELGLPTAPNVTISMTPINPPIIIPPSGGSFSFNASIHNGESSQQALEAWIMVRLPSSAWYGPVLGPLTLTLPAGLTITRTRSLNVPGNAPVGSYQCWGFVGDYPGTVWDSSGFAFSKSGVRDGGDAVWTCTGEEFTSRSGSLQPESCDLKVYPNPFNPSTKVFYSLPEATVVTLRVYSLQGRLVATLADEFQTAGTHEITFDATHLPSGVYWYRMNAGNSQQSGKLVLMK